MDQSHFELNQIIRQCLVHLLITSVFSYVQHNNLTSERKGRGKTEVPWNYVTNKTTILNLLQHLPFSCPKSIQMFIWTLENFCVKYTIACKFPPDICMLKHRIHQLLFMLGRRLKTFTVIQVLWFVTLGTSVTLHMCKTIFKESAHNMSLNHHHFQRLSTIWLRST